MLVRNFSDTWYKGKFIKYNFSSDEQDIHCILSPDGKYIIGAGYPIDGYRPLLAYNIEKGKAETLLSVKSVNPPVTDIRCDLHARFINGGEEISFDTTHNGKREISLVPSKELNSI